VNPDPDHFSVVLVGFRLAAPALVAEGVRTIFATAPKALAASFDTH